MDTMRPEDQLGLVGPGLPPVGPPMMAPVGPPPMDPMGGMPMDPMQGMPPQEVPGPPAPSQSRDPETTLGPNAMPQIEEGDDMLPIYPRWMYERGPNSKKVKKEKKPTRAYMDAAVTSDQLRHSALVSRFADDLRTYRKQDATIFDDLKRDDLEIYVSAAPAIQINKIANMLSNIEHMIQYQYRTEKEKHAAQRMENASYWILEEADRASRNAGNNSIKWEWIFSRALYGRMYTRILPDSTDPEFPWDIRVFDPAQCFPVFGGKKGLIRFSLVYQESVDKILQAYGDDPDVNEKLIKKYTNEETKKLELNKVGEVRECWTPWHRWLEFDGEDIIPVTDHGMGVIPFVGTVGTGEMGSATMPAGMEPTMLEARDLMPFQGQSGVDVDMVHKGQSFFHHQRPALQNEAAVMSIQMTAAKQRLNPPMEKNSPYENPGSPVSMTTGDTNFTRTGEQIRPLLSQANAVDMGVVLSATGKELQKAGLPDHLFGAMEGSNISGFAVENLIASAKDQLQPIITDLEIHLRDVVAMCMYHYRNMGHYFVDDIGGKLTFPAKGRGTEDSVGPARPGYDEMMQMLMQQSQGMPPDIGAWQSMGMDESNIEEPPDEHNYLTREDIIAIGLRPDIKLKSVQFQNMTMLANVASMLIDKKVWSRERAMDEFNIKNPSEEFDRILKEDALTNPKMLELVMFPEALYKSGNMSGFLAYFASVISPILMQMQMAGPMGAGPGGPPPEGGGPQTVQGDSQPMVGQTTSGPTGPGNAGSPGGMM